MTDKWMWIFHGMILTGETEVLGDNHLTVPLCPLRISYWLSWYRNQAAAAVRIRLLTPLSHAWLFLKSFYADDQEFPAFTKYIHTLFGRFQVFTTVWLRASFFWDHHHHHHHHLLLLPFQLRSSAISLEVSFMTVLLWGHSEELILVLWSCPFDLKHVFEGKI
jgi:hypothetical protein